MTARQFQRAISTREVYTDIKNCCVNVPQRWIFAIMCFFGLFNAFAMRGCLSIAITEMVEPTSTENNIYNDNVCPSTEIEQVNNTINNSTSSNKGTYKWSEYTQGVILSSFYWGYIFTHLPGAILADRYGGKHILGTGIFITAVFTILTPAAIYIGDSTALTITRIIIGLGEGITYPGINVMISQWSPPEEKSRMASFIYAGALIGTIYATTISGWILQYSSLGWPLVFYVMGIVSVLWYMIWLLICYNSPKDHPFMSEREKQYLRERIHENQQEKSPIVPWRHILKSKPLWAVIVALVGFNWSILSIITDLPKYMSGVLKLSVENNGYLTSFVYLCMWIGGNTSPWLADYLISEKNIPTTKIRKYGSITALTISASFVVGAAYAGCDRTLVITLFAIAMTLLGTAYPSVMVNPLDLSPNYAGTLTALTNGLSALTGIAGPYIIGVLTTNQSLDEWKSVFWILFVVAVVSNVIFLIWGSGDIQYWNDPEFIRREYNEEERKKSVRENVL